MAKKKNTIPSGFEDILGNIYSNAEQGDGPTNVDGILTGEDKIPFEDDDDKNEPPVKTEDGEQKDDTQGDPHEDNSDIPDDIIENKDNNNTPPEPDNAEGEDDTEPSDADVAEAQQVGLLFDAIGQKLGWNMADIKEDERPLTVEQLTDFWAETIKENSVPEYADERIQQLDEYVRNGGKFEDFYQRQQEALTLEDIDMEDETNQKAVIRELLKRSNYTDEQINKKIARYEDNEMLYEESEDALERLKQIRTQEIEQARQQQEAYAKQQEEQSKAFYQAVTNDINKLTNIRGIAIPKEDRKALFDYIFKVDQNGYTQYQKDYNQNLSKNLIESAYFTMKADALLSGAEKKGESSAAEKLRNIMRHTSKNHSTYNADEKPKSVTDLLAGAF